MANYATSPRYGFRYPSDTPTPNIISDFAALMATMAGDLDSKLTGYKSGTQAARLAATALDGLLWRETDFGGLYLGDGSAWQLVRLSGSSVIATSESRTNTAYGTLTTPDQVAGLIVPTGGLLAVRFQADWSESVAGAARAAIFIGSNQLKIIDSANGAPITQAAATGSASAVNLDTPMSTFPGGLVSLVPQASGYPGDVSTGQVLGLAGNSSLGAENELGGVPAAIAANGIPLAGVCEAEVPAGTYTVSVRFKSSSGSVTALNRRLRCQVLPFPS